MNQDKHQHEDKGKRKDDELTEKEKEKKVDREVKESFPASDPPSYSQPGKEDIKDPEN